eukprot:TRINITY_DN9919_c0_g1_i1.p1 TRINITY_DN9919_c0_g1~~TRINITY_DN9919_c0_g1_i1.p1  ORF type:complete len:866 (+),score=223.13 TRINITY_DN9919_c0_g1_i1:79-2676(+)
MATLTVRPGHEADPTQADVTALFQTQTVDQIRQTLAQKRREAAEQQRELRRLVGDRYHDLLAASDMIVGMGDVCDAIVEAFEGAQHGAAHRRGSSPPRASGAGESDTALHEAVPQLSATLQQVRQWLDERRSLEAALAVRHARRQLERLAAAPCGRGYLAKLLGRFRLQLDGAPREVTRCGAAALAKALRKEAVGSTVLLRLCSEAVAAAALLGGGSWAEALSNFVQDSRRALADPDSACGATDTLSLYFCVRHFLQRAFVDRAYSAQAALSVTGTAVVDAAALEKDPGFRDLAHHVAAAAYFEDGGLGDLPSELPPPDAARRALSYWDAEAAPLAVAALRSTLAGLRSVGAVAELQDCVLRLCDDWRAAGPPLGEDWVAGLRRLLDERLHELLRAELAAFLSDTKQLLADFRQAPGCERLEEIPHLDERQLARRYTVGSARRHPEATRDPSLPEPVRAALEGFDAALARAYGAASVARRCLQKQEVPAGELCGCLSEVAGAAAELCKASPGPAAALVVQGLSRVVAHAAHSSDSAAWLREGAAAKRLDDVHGRLHTAYLAATEDLAAQAAAQFREDIAAVLSETYWGPNAADFAASVSSSWEIREGPPRVQLPGSPTPGVLLALHRAVGASAAPLPSLLRAGAIDALHVRMAEAALPLYAAAVREGRAAPHGEPRVCDAALWQLLFDLRFIEAVLCGRHYQAKAAAPAAQAVRAAAAEPLRLLQTRSAGGIDGTDLRFHEAHINRLLYQSLAASQLLLAAHGVHLPKDALDGPGLEREATYMKLAPECDRLPTLHLAPLQSATANGVSIPSAADAAAARAAAAAAAAGNGIFGNLGPGAAIPGGLSQLGAGLSAQLKGSKLFGW